MTGRHPRPARYQLTFHPAIETDLTALDPDTLDAAQAILDVLVIGARDQHAIYRTAANRIGGPGPADPNAP